ncbi:MAG: aliphatic sulfonate ABC transporter substrate-binding protein [Betaproteobacteria bacterium]
MPHHPTRRTWLKTLLAGIAMTTASFSGSVLAEDIPKEIRLDYAYYSPPSLVIKKFGWLEEEFKPSGTSVRWVFSRGSNNSLEFLNGGSSDFASTSGISALVSRSNGYPVKTVYIFNTQEASTLVVPKDSPIKTVADLKGKKIAATKGTDPYFFLLRALHANGLKRSDVEIVHLQHPEGRTALERKSVDAWAGLDPHLAAAELESGVRTVYRNPAFSSFGFLNTTDDFAKRHPETLTRVLAVYERARLWILANKEETVKIVAEEAKLSLPVIRQQLTRADFTQPIPAKIHIDTVKATAPILVDEEIVKKGVDLDKVISELVDTHFAEAAVKRAKK